MLLHMFLKVYYEEKIQGYDKKKSTYKKLIYVCIFFSLVLEICMRREELQVRWRHGLTCPSVSGRAADTPYYQYWKTSCSYRPPGKKERKKAKENKKKKKKKS